MIIDLNRKNRYEWHWWYAWRPVIIYGYDNHTYLAWLQRIGRRKVRLADGTTYYEHRMMVW